MIRPGWLSLLSRYKGILSCILLLAIVLAGRSCLRERKRRVHYRPLHSMQLRPNAIGRYVINLPDGAILCDWCQGLEGAGRLKIKRDVSREEYEQAVLDRANELKAIPHNLGGTRLERVVKLDLPQCQAVLYWPNTVSPKDLFVDCDGFYLKENVFYRTRIALDVEPKAQQRDLKSFEDKLRSIKFRRPDEIPTEPGPCFDGAILLDKLDRLGEENHEMVSASVRWPERPDVRFEIYIFGNGKYPDPPLLERLKKADAIPVFGVLRSRPRTVGGIRGEEHLERVTENNGTISHLFIWEAQGLPNRFDHPQIRLDMATGHGKEGPVYSSLSDEDALKLWDAVLESLHWRPTIPPTQPGPVVASTS